jgi:hypothetical protein
MSLAAIFWADEQIGSAVHCKSAAGRNREMPQPTTAGRLLETLNEASPATRDTVVYTAALSPERADAAMSGTLRLSLSEQLRLAEATMMTAPRFKREAMRLREQALAARSYESKELVERHRDAPAQRWETSTQLR